MQPIGPAPETFTAKQILAQYGDELEKMIAAAKDPSFEFERQILINQARLNWHFVKGNHYQVPGAVDTAFGQIIDYVPFDATTTDGGNGADMRFCYPLNLIGGDCNKFVAVMGNNAPRVKAIADDPRDNQNIESAQNADANVRDLWTKWQADRQQRVMAFHQYTTGPTYWRTVWVNDARKYGQTVEPPININESPDGLPIPQEGEPRVYVNGDVELRGYTVLEVSHSYMAKTLDDCWWFRCEVMLPKGELLATYAGQDGEPGPLDAYRNSELPDDNQSTSDQLAQEARTSVSSPSGLGTKIQQNHWRFVEYWLEPTAYELTENKELRDILKRQYSDGLYIAKAGKIKLDLDNRRCTDEWSVCKTGRGEKIMEKPIAADAIPYQRAINDLGNLAVETVLRSIAKTIVDSQLVNRESLRENEAAPAEVILTTMPVDGDITKRLVQIPPSRVSDQLAPLMSALREMWQDNTGIRPELSGAGATTNTYREAKQRKDQALMQLSPQAQEMQYCWEDIAFNGVRKRAKFGSGTIKSPRKTSFGVTTDVVEMAQLTETGWHTEADDNFPMTAADRYDKMWGMLKEFPPEVQQALSILDPTNLEQTIEILQIPGFESTVEDQKQKTLADVVVLMAGQAIDGPPGPNGQPGPKQPSIPVDPYDDHNFIVAFLPKWMNSKVGRDLKQQNPQGFDNVVAFWQAHQQMAQPPQPPPPPPVRAAVSFTGKMEDLPPEITNEVLQGAGLPALPQQLSPSPNAVKEAASQPPVEQTATLEPPSELGQPHEGPPPPFLQ